MCLKTNAFFNIDFFQNSIDFGSQVEAQKTDTSKLFAWDGSKLRARGAQEAPRAP